MVTWFGAGEVRCAMLNVGQFEMSAKVLFANAEKESLPVALDRHALPVEPIVFQMNPLFIDTGTHRVLVDPGGLGPSDSLPSSLREVGIGPETIDTIVVTHGHSDHFWGCVGADGVPAFRSARIAIQRREWEHWLADGNPEPHHAQTFREVLLPLRDRVDLLCGDTEIVPGVEAISTPGHSPGHMAVVVAGRAVQTGDAILNEIYVEHPDWCASFELWPDEVVATRRSLLQFIAERDLLMVQPHFPHPGLGRLVPWEDAWTWVPEDAGAAPSPA